MSLLDFRAICLPYCLKQLEDGSYIALNRDYKPLGFNTMTHIKYEEYPIATKYTGLTAKKISELHEGEREDPAYIFLYNDATNPVNNKTNMGKYLKKLEVLATLEVKK